MSIKSSKIDLDELREAGIISKQRTGDDKGEVTETDRSEQQSKTTGKQINPKNEVKNEEPNSNEKSPNETKRQDSVEHLKIDNAIYEVNQYKQSVERTSSNSYEDLQNKNTTDFLITHYSLPRGLVASRQNRARITKNQRDFRRNTAPMGHSPRPQNSDKVLKNDTISSYREDNYVNAKVGQVVKCASPESRPVSQTC